MIVERNSLHTALNMRYKLRTETSENFASLHKRYSSVVDTSISFSLLLVSKPFCLPWTDVSIQKALWTLIFVTIKAFSTSFMMESFYYM